MWVCWCIGGVSGVRKCEWVYVRVYASKCVSVRGSVLQSLSVWMCACVYVWMWMCLGVSVHECVRTCTWIYVVICVEVCVCVCVYVYTCVCVRVESLHAGGGDIPWFFCCESGGEEIQREWKELGDSKTVRPECKYRVYVLVQLSVQQSALVGGCTDKCVDDTYSDMNTSVLRIHHKHTIFGWVCLFHSQRLLQPSSWMRGTRLARVVL